MLKLEVAMVRKVYLDHLTPESYRLSYRGATLYEGSSPEALDAATKAATAIIEAAYPGEDSKVYRTETKAGECDDTRALSRAYSITRKI